MFKQSINSRSIILTLALLNGFAGFHPSTMTANPKWVEPKTDDTFERCKEILNDLLRLQIDNKRLVLDRDHWQNVITKTAGNELTLRLVDQTREGRRGMRFPMERENFSDAVTIFQLLARHIQRGDVGGGGGFGSSSGNGFVAADFNGRSTSGKIESRGQRLEFSISQLAPTERMVQLIEDKDHFLQITVACDSGDRLLVIRQSSDRFVVVFVSDQEAFSVTAKTYSDLFRDNPTLIQQTVLPLLTELGFAKQLNTDSISVITVMLQKISAITSPVSSEAADLFQQLASEQFAQRERALEELRERFKDHHSAIENALQSSSLLPEVRGRLERLVNEHRSLHLAEHQLIESLGLLEDIPYLIRLFEFANENQQQSLGQYLEKLTQQTFGSDAEAWQIWLANRSEAMPAIDH